MSTGKLYILKNKLKSSNFVIISLISFLCISLLIYLYSNGISGNDFWWHIKSGEWIVFHKAVPTTDVFSWYASVHNFEWVSQEWLSEVILYGIYHLLGEFGVFFMCLLLGIAMILICVFINKKHFMTNVVFSLFFMLLLTLMIYMFFYGRPHIFSFFLLVATLAILFKYKANETKLIFLLPLIAIIWANIHGGSSNLVYILTIIFIVSGLFSFDFGKLASHRMPFKKIITMLGVAVISALFICINPHGIKILIYPYTNMADSTMLDFLTEWQSPDPKQLGVLISCFLPLILIIINIICSNKKLELTDFLLFGFFTFMFLRSQRFIILLMLSSMFYIFKYSIPFTTNNSKLLLLPTNKKFTKIVLCWVTLIFVFITSLGIINLRKTVNAGNLISTYVDERFINLVKEDNPQRLYNDYDFGGSLIYNDIQVFVDGRADIYSGKILDDYISLSRLNYNSDSGCSKENFVEELIEKYNFDAFLISPKRSIYFYLCDHPEKYVIIDCNDDFAYFKRIK
ncbi:MAG: hypothetical protein ACI4DS_05510 [Eubacterium sp.]